MDNPQQIQEIIDYCRHLSRLAGRMINPEIAARIWIRKYARVWRLKHQVPEQIAA
jgi:hypothetical protein